MGIRDLANMLKSEEESLPIEKQFIKAIDGFIVTKGKERNAARERRRAFNPSSIYDCPKALYFYLSGCKPTESVTALGERWLDIGTVTHRWIQDEILMPMAERGIVELIPGEELPSFGKEGFEILKEHNSSPIEVKFLDKRFTEEIPISAMVDGAICLGTQRFVFEFKTIKQEKFEELVKPLDEHIKQGAIYNLCLGLPVMFLYINKNFQTWKCFFVTYTEEQINDTRSYIQYIEECVLEGTEPSICDKSKCKYCKFKKYCKNR